MHRRRWLLLLGVVAACGWGKPTVEVVADHEDGCYAPGEAVTFTITVADGDTVPTGGTVRWQLSNDGVGDLGRGEAAWAGQPLTATGKLAQPGVLRLTAFWDAGQGDRPVMGLGGAAIAYDQIPPSAPEPDDFMAWWAAQKALLAKVPMNPELTRDEQASSDTVDVYRMHLGNIDGSLVRGWFCRPKQPGKYPAILMIPGAALAATRPSPGYAAQGYLSVNISVHDQPMDREPEFYQDLQKPDGALPNYRLLGRESRETYYFRRVFLSFVRVIDFLTSQEDWDGQHMVVYGSSQGGGSTLAAAGLDPRVTCAAANVPALCDHLGLLLGRPSGWPKIVSSPEAKAEIATAQYFDGVNFARHIACPIMVSVGLRDTTCPATTGLAAYNAIPHDRKRMMIFPTMGHAIDPAWNAAVAEFFAAHVKGGG